MTARRRRRASVAALALMVVVAACGSDDGGDDGANRPRPVPGATQTTDAGGDFPQVSVPATDGSLEAVGVQATEVARLDSPIKLVARPGTRTMFVAERAGTVRTLDVAADGTGTVGDDVVLDISDQTTTDGERGLLGLAFSADGDTLYVSHTNADGNSRVASYAMDGDAADASTRKELLAVDQPFPNHNGGNIVLGPDGALWLGLGDGGAGDDPDNRAQDPENPLGKLLRIDPASPGEPDIWALGLRNPWRFSFDRTTDDLWIADVGQDAIEEIDFLPAGTERGTNFGWSGYEGSSRHIEDRVPDQSVPPVHEMGHDDGWCSVTGGVIYRGKRIPALDGTYLFGDFCKAGLHGLRLTKGVVSDERELLGEPGSLVSIDEGPDGEVYLVSLDGSISRLDPT